MEIFIFYSYIPIHVYSQQQILKSGCLFFFNLSQEQHIKRHRKRQSQNFEKMSQTQHPRQKRHVGPHDDDGIQRLLSTGTLAPTTLAPSHPKYNHSIDVIFATYWFFPAKTQAILPKDQLCISQKMDEEKSRFDFSSMLKYFIY